MGCAAFCASAACLAPHLLLLNHAAAVAAHRTDTCGVMAASKHVHNTVFSGCTRLLTGLSRTHANTCCLSHTSSKQTDTWELGSADGYCSQVGHSSVHAA